MTPVPCYAPKQLAAAGETSASAGPARQRRHARDQICHLPNSRAAELRAHSRSDANRLFGAGKYRSRLMWRRVAPECPAMELRFGQSVNPLAVRFTSAPVVD